MDLHAEAFPDQLRQFLGPQRRLGCSRLLDKFHDLGSQLVRPAWPSFLRDQAGEASLLEGRLCLVKRRAGETERGGGLAHRILFHFDAAQHLVLDLEQVPGIEEFVVLEQPGRDRLGMGVEGSLLSQGVGFSGPAFSVGHGHLPGKCPESL